MRARSKWSSSAGTLILAMALVGCQASPRAGMSPAPAGEAPAGRGPNVISADAVLHGQPFAAISRPLSGSESSLRALRIGDAAVPTAGDTDQSFYIAIHKSELGTRWFLSAYLAQYFPGAAGSGAAHSLGTRVVTFRVQNGKLFVFDASDATKDSNTFDPEVLIEAYPIVTDFSGFATLPGADGYILFDPSAGLNHFSLLADAFAAGSQPAQFTVDVSYLQNFRALSDGATFEQVFTGDSNVPTNDGTGGEDNAFRSSGTLGLSLRRYSEGAGFSTPPSPPEPYYFLSRPRLVPNTGTTTENPIKWNIHKGMKPIEWIISDKVLALKNDPVYGKYDVYGALKKAVENWNQAFGFPVVTARLATSKDSFDDDDKNFIIWDDDPSLGAAFADFRTNPNTGEIRGATVYFSSVFLQIADQEFGDASAAGHPVAPSARPKVATLQWDAMPEHHLCTLWANQLRDTLRLAAAQPNPTLTKKEEVEAVITHTLLHEFGHTFGLRHNFKGSLEPITSSVMDYLLDSDAVTVTTPQKYDVEAIQYLYGLSTKLPDEPFCTDEDIAVDPTCNQFDRGADPLSDYYAPGYGRIIPAYLKGSFASFPPDAVNQAIDADLNDVLKFVRAGATPQIRLQAWEDAIGPVHVPLAASNQKDAAYAQAADALSARIFSRLYLDPATQRGDIVADPPAADAGLTQAVVTELTGNLLDTDGVRSFATRRLCVDVLKHMQTVDAYEALLDTRKALATTLASASGDTAAETQDLLARIDQATGPYFK